MLLVRTTTIYMYMCVYKSVSRNSYRYIYIIFYYIVHAPVYVLVCTIGYCTGRAHLFGRVWSASVLLSRSIYYLYYRCIHLYSPPAQSEKKRKKFPAYKIYYLVRVIILVVFINFPFAASSSLERCRCKNVHYILFLPHLYI